MARDPLSTYRLQLRPEFTFEDACGVLDYLDELGITDVYVSPILRAERHSAHGYNVCAHDCIDPELGGAEGFAAFSDARMARGLRLLVDIVPNHMGIATGENAWWNDVLENGPSSRFADFFDIDWDPGKASLRGRVLYPILGAQYGDVLENSELVLVRRDGTFFVDYHEHRLPVAPRSLLPLLELSLAKLGRGENVDPESDLAELESIRMAIRNLPERGETAPERRLELAREKEIIKGRTRVLCSTSERIAAAIDDAVAEYNGRRGCPSSFDRLDALLGAQNYRLSYWRVASEEINYRRFFDINQLVALRMERPVVFEAAHALLLDLARQGRIDGFRLDHTDGLYDPADYFASLRAAGASDRFVVAEKILEPGERLPRAWQIDGTTGYDALAVLSGLWVDASAQGAFSSLYRRVTGDTSSFETHVYESQRVVIRGSFASEINVLSRALERIAESQRRSRDFTQASLHDAIVETIAAFPVYRTYLRADGSREPNDNRHIARAIDLAKRRNPEVDASIFDFLRDVLLCHESNPSGTGRSEPAVSFAMRFQQLTGPIMAKGVEDTAMYRYARLISLNEVGGDPARFGTSVPEFHAAARARLAEWPRSMVASSTHDTKRGEDMRARLMVMTENPERWASSVDVWMAIGEHHRRTVDGEPAPSAKDRYLFVQTVLGAWPFTGIDSDRPGFVSRLVAYMTKACREAKMETSWLHPNQEYEAATEGFVRDMLADDAFVRSIAALADETATHAATNGLAQIALKLVGPGIADTFQGCELWNFSLVDPDNRRPVDYEARRAALHRIQEGQGDRKRLARSLVDQFEDGVVKLYVTHTLLQLRRRRPSLVLRGAYRAVDGGEHVVAFVREDGEGALACIVPRLSWKLTGERGRWPLGAAWGDRTLPLPASSWTNVLTDERHRFTSDALLREVFASFPVAVLLAN